MSTATDAKQGTDPAFTAKTEDDLMTKCVHTVDAYRLQCKYCERVTPICENIAAVVAKAKELGMMVVTIDQGFMDKPTLVCAKCAKRDIASFRHDA